MLLLLLLNLQECLVCLAALSAHTKVMDDAAGSKFLAAKRADQRRALQRLQEDPELRRLDMTEAPLVDLEVRGVPALQYFGDVAWKSSAPRDH